MKIQLETGISGVELDQRFKDLNQKFKERGLKSRIVVRVFTTGIMDVKVLEKDKVIKMIKNLMQEQ